MQLYIILSLYISHLCTMPLQEADEITGFWISPQKDIIVECYRTKGGSYNGKLVWFKKLEDKPRYDCEVPEDEWIGKDILWDFEYEDEEWTNGEIKDLKKCNTYDSFITINDKNELTVTGYVGFRWLGESMVFDRHSGILPEL